MSAKDKKETLKKLIIDAWVDGHEKTSPHKGSIDYDADLEGYLNKVSPIVNEMCEGNTLPDTGSGLHLADVIKSVCPHCGSNNNAVTDNRWCLDCNEPFTAK